MVKIFPSDERKITFIYNNKYNNWVYYQSLFKEINKNYKTIQRVSISEKKSMLVFNLPY